MDTSARTKGMLVVDLDGTLLRSDMLIETFWSAFGKDWRSPFLALAALRGGKAVLKRHLAGRAALDVSLLPYDRKIVAFVQAWRDAGGRTALVTATDERIAKAIADHLEIFDEVHGSDGTVNLIGARKAEFLEARFGTGQFAYIGDATADLPVWKQAAKAITVNVPTGLRKQVERINAQVEHLVTEERSPWSYVRALRPHQWSKNILVFVPMLAAHQLDGPTFLASLLAFVAFCMIASSVYVLNDLLDLAADRAHPRKRLRPLAAGDIPIRHGTWMAFGLPVLGAFISLAAGPRFLVVMAIYYLLTAAYSLHLKRQIVLDICVLAGLYTTRLIAGGVATQIGLSVWLLAFSVFFFLSMAAVKRQTELIDSDERGNMQPDGRGYHVNDLPIISMIAIAAGYVAVLVLTLYVSAPGVTVLYARPEFLWGGCAVLLYWITRTIMIAHRGQMHDDPVVYAAKDRVSQICLILMLCFGLAGAMT